MNPAALAGLREVAAEHGLPPDATDRLRGLLRVLATDATAPTSVREPASAVDVHVRDSLDGLRLSEVRAARRIADLGAGAGFPGLVLAVALPQAAVRLVESVGRKCQFLGRAATEMALDNVEVVHARAEDWPAGIGAHDVVTARALAPLTALAEYAAPLLAPDGHLVAWKGAVGAEEEADGRAAAAILGLGEPRRVQVPPRPGADLRSLWLLHKEAETPATYPRRPGMARKRPIRAGA
ncbi:MAG: 16S rRNA (guanine(527)-N(7))-methyltransferase [uncultured Thermoleophilia bacterium]|uniref:Ribosomal RNA small subunit methyltransferase G n=1 Tax=uncultured Thermoleophilia bacterium TaxID=1497501 RepID=A0A6J4UT12_9ACTN|nr:MAG: 16S rRNA (guanine(527)-N(7))-methyltransferase [uncultured Thermoleophilia bacterium]